MVHYIKQSFLKKNLTLTSLHQDKIKPCVFVENKKVPKCWRERPRCPYVSLSAIVLLSNYTSYEMNISRINFTSTQTFPILFESSKVQEHLKDVPINNINITVINCSFKGIYRVFKVRRNEPLTSNFKFYGHQSTFEGCKLISVSKKSKVFTNITLNFSRCTFANQAMVIDISLHKSCLRQNRKNTRFHVNLHQSIFFNSALFFGHCFRVNITKTKFASTKLKTSFLTVTNTKYKVLIKDSSFENNHILLSNKIGAALLFLRNRKIELINCTFNNNTASSGGAIYADGEHQTVKIRDGSFHSNHAKVGGTIYSNVKEMNITNTIINSSNLAIHSAGKLILLNVKINNFFSWSNLQFVDMVNGYGDTKDVKNSSLICAQGYRAEVKQKHDTYFFPKMSCIRCETGTYSLQHGKASLLDIRKKAMNVTNIICQDCPSEAVCGPRVTSRDNFWGFVQEQKNTKDQKLKFLPCPNSYCCSKLTTKCTSYNTCRNNRTGILCGRCKDGFSLKYFNSKCSQIRHCNHKLFWFVAFIYVAVYTVILIYLNDIIAFLTKLLQEYNKQINQRSLNEGPLTTTEGNSTDLTTFDQETIQSKIESSIGSNITNICFFFYQVAFLIQVSSFRKIENGFLHASQHFLLDIFTFDNMGASIIKACPSNSLQEIKKQNIKVFIVICYYLAIPVCYAINKVYTICKNRNRSKKKTESQKKDNNKGSITFKLRLKLHFIQLLLLTYVPIASYSFRMINCIQIQEKKHLFIYADLACYTSWQYTLISFIVLWILPFPVALHLAPKMLCRKQISQNTFLACLAVPIFCCGLYMKNNNPPKHSRYANKKFEETERFLSALGNHLLEQKEKYYVSWDVVIIIRRLILTALSTFIVNPVQKLYTTIPVLILFGIHTAFVLPYKEHILNRLELGAITVLAVFSIIDILWAFDYMTDLSNLSGGSLLVKFSAWIEDILLTFPVIAGAGAISYLVINILLKLSFRIYQNRRKMRRN